MAQFRRDQRKNWAWRDVAPARVGQVQRRSDPAINTGVMVFDRPATQLVASNEMAQAGSSHEIPDEIAMQLLLPELDHELLPEAWNFSPLYGTERAQTRIWHFHNTTARKRQEWPESGEIYQPLLAEVKNGNFGDIKHWPPQ